MNTILLVLNTIMNIFIIFNILSIKHNNDKSIRNNVNKFIDTVKDKLNYDESKDFNSDDFDDIWPEHTTASSRLQKLRQKWDEEDIEEFEDAEVSTYETFKDEYDFIDYLSNHNLDIYDIVYEKVCKVKYLDTVSNDDKKYIIITFDNDSQAVFDPKSFAKYYNKED